MIVYWKKMEGISIKSFFFSKFCFQKSCAITYPRAPPPFSYPFPLPIQLLQFHLLILKRPPTDPILFLPLPSPFSPVPSGREQQTPNAHGGQAARARDAEREGGLRRGGVARVGVEGGAGVERGGQNEGWKGEGVGGGGGGRVCGEGWLEGWLDWRGGGGKRGGGWGGELLEGKEWVSGMEFVRIRVTRARVNKVRDRDRQK